MVVAAFKDEIPSFPTGLSTSVGDDTLRDMEIAGAVDGDIAGRTITVLESGSIHGTVGADTIVISGTVNGSINAHNIELLATARVEGELHYDNLTVITGAHMEARCTPAAA
ncbi:MAG: polymer-forming cytoskeletal protein [Rhodospirillaceae bacterium]|nr:polymer-forming cytoskeletal protein [Rhodospirillaceae bacterium]MBL6941987.1 polymer-forming cytoskeletal protein [Rhodospirillales bacterium]